MASDFVLRNAERMKRTGMISARKRLKLSQEAMAERLGVSTPQVSRWETGKDGIPSQRIPSLVDAYEARIEELFASEADVIDSIPPPNARVVRYEGASDVVLPRDIPIFGTILGAPLDFDGRAIEQATLNSGDPIGYLPRPTVLNGQKGAYGLYVQGSSMAPRFEDGETIFVQDSRLGRPARIGDDVAVYMGHPDEGDGERATGVLVKRLVRRNSEFVELEQFTPHVRFQVTTSQVLRIDRVIPWSELLS